MLIWTIFAAMTGAAVFALLWPLGRRHVGAFADTADATSLYRAQLREIDRDLDRQLIGTPDAEAAKAEAARRLLRAAGGEDGPAGETESSLRRRRASSALALSCVPLLALLTYGAFGSPDAPDQPLAARLQAEPSRQDFEVALARIETHLAANPGDARGWAVVAPIYLRQGRFDEAVRAFQVVTRQNPGDSDALSGLGEAQALAAGGVVTAAARESFAEAVRQNAGNARARFFLAIAREQDGDNAGAIAALRDLLKDAPPDAGWIGAVRERLERLEADAGANAIASLPSQDQQAAIRGMVAGLAERLRQGGGELPDWLRLIRSQMVLGDRQAARESVATARQRLAQDGAAITQIDALAGELGLKETLP